METPNGRSFPYLGAFKRFFETYTLVQKEKKNPLFANYIEPQKALGMTLQGARRMRGWNRLVG